jgi:endo-1,4-beta-xylanase
MRALHFFRRRAGLIAVAWGAALVIGAAATTRAADGAAATPGGPGQTKGRGGPGPKGPRPDFWSGTLNHAASFDNRGIATFGHGTLTSRVVRFRGAAETEVGYTVYLPPAYAAQPERRFPVVYFLHGLGGNESTVAPVVQQAHTLITAGSLPPFLIVSAAAGRSFYGNQFEGRFQVHDFYISEFIPHIDRTYRTRAERSGRHLMGFSMGGYGALLYAVKHPELFGAATNIGGALGAARNNGWKEMYDASEEHYRPFDLHRLTTEHPDRLRRLRLAIWIGSDDIVRMANVQYHDLLNAQGIAHHYHDWNSRPKLQGVGHSLPRYIELHGREILQFHAEDFAP